MTYVQSSSERQPIIIGGNGHSGTRIFTVIINQAGVFTGIRHLTKRANSEDLRIVGLLNRWAEPYVHGSLEECQLRRMKRALARRLRIYFPVRSRAWGFKNPRSMLILPVLHDLFPRMKFVHVIRDGRDISLGNVFVSRNRYVDAFLSANERSLPAEQKMILFWGRSNEMAGEYGVANLQERYKLVRWEDLCTAPVEHARELIQFAGGTGATAEAAAQLVGKPSSIGRWRAFPESEREPVVSLGSPWLKKFGYL